MFLIRLLLLLHYKNDTFLSINVDIILLWSGIAGQLLFTKSCCLFAVNLVVSYFAALQLYKTLTRHCGLSGNPASSFKLGQGRKEPGIEVRRFENTVNTKDPNP